MLQVSVADHDLKVIAADGYAVQPMTVDVVHMMPGMFDQFYSYPHHLYFAIYMDALQSFKISWHCP